MREKYPRLWTLVVTIAIVLVVGVEITTSRGSIEDCEDLLDETDSEGFIYDSEVFISDGDHDTLEVNSALLMTLLVVTLDDSSEYRYTVEDYVRKTHC